MRAASNPRASLCYFEQWRDEFCCIGVVVYCVIFVVSKDKIVRLLPSILSNHVDRHGVVRIS